MGGVCAEDPAQMRLTEHDHVVEAFRQRPVRTAPRSLGWREAAKKAGVSFVDIDKLCEVIDAEACEGRYGFFTGAEDGEAAVFRIHFDADFLQQVLVLAQHFGDTGDCEDVADRGHDQACVYRKFDSA
jgi:hypothetical protein